MSSNQFYGLSTAFLVDEDQWRTAETKLGMQRTDSGYGSSSGCEYISPSELVSPVSPLGGAMDWSPTNEELVSYGDQFNYTTSSYNNTGYVEMGYEGYDSLQTSYGYEYSPMQSSSTNWNSGASHVEQGSSSQGPKEYQCMHEGCTQKPFKRSADLDRHLKQVHFKYRESETYSCDYRKCMQENADKGVTFHRKDHFRDHVREFHKEDMLKRGNKDHASWLKDRRMNLGWWRCSKCLARIQIKNNASGDSKWECPECRVSIESARKKEREHRQKEEDAREAAEGRG